MKAARRPRAPRRGAIASRNPSQGGGDLSGVPTDPPAQLHAAPTEGLVPVCQSPAIGVPEDPWTATRTTPLTLSGAWTTAIRYSRKSLPFDPYAHVVIGNERLCRRRSTMEGWSLGAWLTHPVSTRWCLKDGGESWSLTVAGSAPYATNASH
jgi:hypothetical protein